MNVRLPNGMNVQAFGKLETFILYKECFEDEVYARYRNDLKAHDVIFDVGANIGMFALSVGQTLREFTLYSFEPVPAIFEKLRQNTRSLAGDVKLFNLGLSARAGQVEFAFSPRLSCMSTANIDHSVKFRTILKQQFIDGANQNGPRWLRSLIVSLLSLTVLRSRKVRCELRRLSDIIASERVSRIDLLKIDVEGGEWDVLQGIDEGDWEKIQQIVMEVHDVDGAGHAARITRLLEARKFEVIATEEDGAGPVGLSMLHARRGGVAATSGSLSSTGPV
jgi:FkbM family methyltransferase